MFSLSSHTDSIGLASDMHRTAHTAFDGLSNYLLSIDNNLIDNSSRHGVDRLKDLVNAIESSRKNILVNFSKIDYMKDYFFEFRKYARSQFGNQALDAILTQEQVTVFDSFARISSALGEPISESNIKAG